MIVIGLTGGIGMGKSTAAALFRRARLPVFDADRTVHDLQRRDPALIAAIGAAFPGTVREGRLDRTALRAAVLGRPEALRLLESLVHPRVREAERRFLRLARKSGVPAAVLDIPLLFETGRAGAVDKVVVVSAPAPVQLARVKRRRRMSEAEIRAILARQTPDALKRRQADVVVPTGLSRHHAYRRLRRLILDLYAGRCGTGARPARPKPSRRRRA
jgi:dephospho-CoA kinase